MTQKNQKLESAISLTILAALLAIAAAIYLKQTQYDKYPYTITTAAAAQPKPAETLQQHLPTDFTPLSPAETYNPDTLYEKINGKAELYLPAGFQKLQCQRFAHQNQTELWIEIFIYDMADDMNAFAVYSQQRRPDAQPLPDAQFAYQTTDALFFAQGPFYIEIRGSEISPILKNAMTLFAQNFISQNPAQGQATAVLNLFPQQNLIPHSQRFYPQNTFSCQGFNQTFAAQYEINDDPLTAFICKLDSPQLAQKTAQNYYDFLINNGATPLTADHLNHLNQPQLLDFYGTCELLFTQGQFFAGVHQALTTQSAQQLAQQLNQNLSEANKNDPQ